jgi:hypothetical protein
MGLNNLNEHQIVIYCSLGSDFDNKIRELGFQIKSIEEAPVDSIEVCKYQYKDYMPLIQKMNIFIKPLQTKEKILIIIRASKRILLNHNELLIRLHEFFKERYDIEEASFDNKTLKEQIDIMQNCKILIGAHGAGFTNMLFLNENTHVIEMFPESFYINCYEIIAKHKKLHHHILHGKDLIKPHISLDEFTSLVNEGKMWNPTNPYVSQLRDLKGFSVNIDDVVKLINTIA